MAGANLKNQIQDLTDRLDELNRITRLCAIGKPVETFEGSGIQADETVVGCLPHTASLPSCISRAVTPDQMICLNSLERMPHLNEEISPLNCYQSPVSTFLDVNIEQSQQLFKLQDRQLKLQDHLTRLMQRLDQQEQSFKASCISSFPEPDDKEHDIDEHMQVLTAVTPSSKRTTTASKSGPGKTLPTSRSRLISKNYNSMHLSELENRNNPKRIPRATKRECSRNGDRVCSKSSEQKVIPDDERKLCSLPNDGQINCNATETQVADFEIPLKSDLREIKEELSIIRNIFDSELQDVRECLQRNLAEVKSRHTEQIQSKMLQSAGKENSCLDCHRDSSNVNPCHVTLATDKQFSTEARLNGVKEPVTLAWKALREAEHRRYNLENNLLTYERDRKCQDVFEILDALGKDEESVERARIKSLVDDAIIKLRSRLKALPVAGRQKQFLAKINRPPSNKGAISSVAASETWPQEEQSLAALLSSPQKSLIFQRSFLSGGQKGANPNPYNRLLPSRTQLKPKAKNLEKRTVNKPMCMGKAVRFLNCDALNIKKRNRETMTEPLAIVSPILMECTIQNPSRVSSSRSIQPLGIRQYSMLPEFGQHVSPTQQRHTKEMPSLNNNEEQNILGFIHNHPIATEFPRTDDYTREDIFQRHAEGGIVRRLFSQLEAAFVDEKSLVHRPSRSCLKDIIEAELLERLTQGDLISSELRQPSVSAPFTPEPLESSTVSSKLSGLVVSDLRDALNENSKTLSPQSASSENSSNSVCDRSVSAKPLSKFSPSKRDVSPRSMAISVQSFLKSVQNAHASQTNHLSTHTLEDLSSLSDGKSREFTQILDPELFQESGTSATSSGLETPQQLGSLHRPLLKPSQFSHTALVPLDTPPMHTFTSCTPCYSVSSNDAMDDFSLTAPHSFSDGMWFEERSDGEAACYSKGLMESAGIYGPLPCQDSSEYASDFPAVNKKGDASEGTSSTSSIGELKAEKLGREQRGRPWTAPWKNPLLHLIALNAASGNSRLPWNKFVEVQRTAVVLRNRRRLDPDAVVNHPDINDGEAVSWVDKMLAELQLPKPDQASGFLSISPGEVRTNDVRDFGNLLVSVPRLEPSSFNIDLTTLDSSTTELLSLGKQSEQLLFDGKSEQHNGNDAEVDDPVSFTEDAMQSLRIPVSVFLNSEDGKEHDTVNRQQAKQNDIRGQEIVDINTPDMQSAITTQWDSQCSPGVPGFTDGNVWLERSVLDSFLVESDRPSTQSLTNDILRQTISLSSPFEDGEAANGLLTGRN